MGKVAQQRLLFLRRYEPDQVRGFGSQHADAHTPERPYCRAFADVHFIVALNDRFGAANPSARRSVSGRLPTAATGKWTHAD